jgi:hypothetical protein
MTNSVIICSKEFIFYLNIASPKFRMVQNADTVMMGVTLMKSITKYFSPLTSLPNKNEDILGKQPITVFNKISLTIDSSTMIMV